MSLRTRPVLAAVAAIVPAILGVGVTAIGQVAHAVGAADYSVEQTVSGPAVAGSMLTYVATVRNAGPDAGSNVIAAGGVYGGSLKSVSGTGALCAKGRNSVYTCNFPTLASGATAQLVITMQIDNSSPMVSSRVSVQYDDIDPTNNTSALDVVTAASPGDLQLGANASDKSPNAGATVDYRFAVKNGSKNNSTGVSFDAALSSDAVLYGISAASGAVCTQSGTLLHCDLGMIAAGSQDTVTVSVAAPAVGASLSMSATVTPANGDSNVGNNAGTTTVTSR